jgi:hypothetical protein
MLPTSRRFHACLPSLATNVLGDLSRSASRRNSGSLPIGRFPTWDYRGVAADECTVALSELGEAAKAPEADDRDSNPERPTILSQFSRTILPQLVLQKNYFFLSGNLRKK